MRAFCVACAGWRLNSEVGARRAFCKTTPPPQTPTVKGLAVDVAAAFVKMYLSNKETDTATVVDDFENTGAEDGMARLFINIGKNQKVTAGNILGAIAGESGIKGNLVGSIDMYDKYTFVEVPKHLAAEVMAAMKNVKIKGKPINIEPANRK